MNCTQHVSTGINGMKGNEILAMVQQTEEGTMVAIKPLCTALKIDLKRQYERIASDARFSCRHMPMTGADGKRYEMVCLPAEQVPDWINSINSRKVAKEKAAALLELQKFFQAGLNEIVRGGLASRSEVAELRATVEKLTGLVATMIDRMEGLERENHQLRKASRFRGSAAAYDMLSRKAEKAVEEQVH